MRVLVVGEDVDEDEGTCQSYVACLRDDGHAVDAVGSLVAAQRAVADVDYDCVVASGLDRGARAAEFMAEIRRQRPTRPVLVVMGDEAPESRIAVLAAGADDLLACPVALGELAVRVRKLLVRGTSPPRSDPGHQCVGRLALHRGRREVLLDGEPLALPFIQYMLLERLMGNRGRVVTAHELLQCAWDRNHVFNGNPLPPQISRLRRKLRGSVRIEAIRDNGYRLSSAPGACPLAPGPRPGP